MMVDESDQEHTERTKLSSSWNRLVTHGVDASDMVYPGTAVSKLVLVPLKLHPVTTQMHQRWLRPWFNRQGHRCVGNQQLNQCKWGPLSINS